MLEYSSAAKVLQLKQCPPNIDFKLDEIPLAHPRVPRICNEQGHMLLWWGTPETDGEPPKQMGIYYFLALKLKTKHNG